MILATYDNTVIGDRLWITANNIDIPDFNPHFDIVSRKYNKGNKALVLDCDRWTGNTLVIPPNEVEAYGFGIELGPVEPEADRFGFFTIFVVTTANGHTAAFKQYLDCVECEHNFQRAVDGIGYVPHYFSQSCRSGKRPHCTCDTCF